MAGVLRYVKHTNDKEIYGEYIQSYSAFSVSNGKDSAAISDTTVALKMGGDHSFIGDFYIVTWNEADGAAGASGTADTTSAQFTVPGIYIITLNSTATYTGTWAYGDTAFINCILREVEDPFTVLSTFVIPYTTISGTESQASGSFTVNVPEGSEMLFNVTSATGGNGTMTLQEEGSLDILFLGKEFIVQ